MDNFHYKIALDVSTFGCGMVEEIITSNAFAINEDLDWLNEILTTRLNLFLGNESKYKDINQIKPPKILNENCSYYSFINNFSFEERLIFVLSLVIHIRPQLFDALLLQGERTGKPFTEFGGKVGPNHRGFIPTGETVLFILAYNNTSKRISISKLFDSDHFFSTNEILYIDKVEKGEPPFSGAIILDPKILQRITSGSAYTPVYNSDFPAIKLKTNREWNEKVFNTKTNERLEEVKIWVENAESLRSEWELQNIINPGYRCLFYGPPGTGKTFTATLLGKATGRDVYRIDLSGLVSKYVGETIKNLEKVFKQAGNAILFFDEADAMFGKRTQVKDANDRFANQEVSYLLQRIEVYEGVVILASNLKDNLDDAFMRRFNSVIYFPLPKEKERQTLWNISFPKIKPEDDEALLHFGKKYELSGGNITNAAHFASMLAYTRIKALREKLNLNKPFNKKEKIQIEEEIAAPVIKTHEIFEAITREFAKEKKSMPRDGLKHIRAI